MKSMYRLMLAGVVAALAFSAVVASAASAHEFRVAGSPVTVGTNATGSGGGAELVWTVSKANVRIECKTTALTDVLEAGGKSTGEITLQGCSTPESKNCSVPNVSYKVGDSLGGVKGALTDEFSSPTGVETLFHLAIKNSGEHTCSLKGEYPVVGKYTCALPKVETEAVEHEVACKPEGSELKIDGEKLTMSYSDQVRLTSDLDWSAV